MKVISTNIGSARLVEYKGKEVTTGIFKYPVEEGITLGSTDVNNDHVIDRKYHGGLEKACYLFGLNHYDYWKSKYSNLEWHHGMFGENLSIDHFDESQVFIGSIYQIGTATIQISRPRQPCFKLGIKFGTQRIIKEFNAYKASGTYVRVLENGQIKSGDTFTLISEGKHQISIRLINELIFHFDKTKHEKIAQKVIEDPEISDGDKKYIIRNLERKA